MLFSANLGLLYRDRSLIDAIFAAKKAGFDAVECHWPYDVPADQVKQALDEAGLSMISLNAHRGDHLAGENGLSALPARQRQARDAIDEAIDYACDIGCHKIHVMAGVTSVEGSEITFIDNLIYACERAAPHDITILIEPLNDQDAPGYFLNDISLATKIIKQVNKANLKLMFDCYHIQILHGDVLGQLHNVFDIIGHIQFASVPDRGAPDHGDVNYKALFAAIKALGYDGPLGAEYNPANGDTDASLDWLNSFKNK